MVISMHTVQNRNENKESYEGDMEKEFIKSQTYPYRSSNALLDSICG